MGIVSKIRESIRTAKSNYYAKKKEELKKDLNLEKEAQEMRKLEREKEIVAKTYRPKETKFQKLKKFMKEKQGENNVFRNSNAENANPFTSFGGSNPFYQTEKKRRK